MSPPSGPRSHWRFELEEKNLYRVRHAVHCGESALRTGNARKMFPSLVCTAMVRVAKRTEEEGTNRPGPGTKATQGQGPEKKLTSLESAYNGSTR